MRRGMTRKDEGEMMDRRRLVYWPLFSGLAMLGALSVPVAADAAQPCAVVTGGVTYPTLQEAVDAATPGHTVRVSGTCEGEVTISKDLTIKGQGAATLKGGKVGGEEGVITISAGSSVTITGLTITGGELWGISNSGAVRVVRSTVTGNQGGIFSDGLLTVSESTVSGNRVTDRDLVGIWVGCRSRQGCLESNTIKDSTITGNRGGSGGGIRNGGTLTITKSTVSDNEATGSGGGIQNDWHLTVVSSTIAGNRAASGAGGIFTAGSPSGRATLKNSTVSGNTAGWGGGIQLITESQLTLINSTVTGNAAVGGQFEGNGGGIWSGGSLLLAGSSSVTDNTAVEHGGGIFTVACPSGATLTYAPNWRGTISANEPDDIFTVEELPNGECAPLP